MKVLVSADRPLSDEILTRRISSGAELIIVNNAKEFSAHGDAQLFLDLNPAPGIESIYAKLAPRPVLVNSVIESLSKYNGLNNVGRINGWPGMLARVILEIVSTDPITTKNVDFCLTELGWKFALAPDIPGMISARIIAMIINEAYFALGENVSSREEIDIAMKTGTNYPFGPFEWTKKIGADKVLQLLIKMNEEDQRYTIAPALLEEVQISA